MATKKILLTAVCYWAADNAAVIALLPVPKAFRITPTRATTSHHRGLTMYFDDVSRGHCVRWQAPATTTTTVTSSSSSSSSSASLVPQHTTGRRSTTTLVAPTMDLTTVVAPEQHAPRDPVAPPPPPPRQNSTTTITVETPTNSSTRVVDERTPWIPHEREMALEQRLHGYTLARASQLTAQEVESQTRQWAQRAGVVGNKLGDELYRSLYGVQVAAAATATSRTSSSSSVLTAVAQTWQFIAGLVDDCVDDDYHPVRWCPPPGRGELALFVLAQSGAALYDYSTLFTLVASIEFSKPLCQYLGRRFSVTLFHPHYKRAPAMFSPERHSPFPTVGLHLQNVEPVTTPRSRKKAKDDGRPTRQRGNMLRSSSHAYTDADDADNDEMHAAVDRALRHGIDSQRQQLELLFNLAAASTTHDQLSNRRQESALPPKQSRRRRRQQRQDTDDDDDDVVDPNDAASLDVWQQFRDEQDYRRHTLPAANVRNMTAVWMQTHLWATHGKAANVALRYVDTIQDWIVCGDKMGERVYAAVWQVIATLWEQGQALDDDNNHEPAGPATALSNDDDTNDRPPIEKRSSSTGASEKPPTARFDHFDFLKSLSRSWKMTNESSSNRSRSGSSTSGHRRRAIVHSVLFVTPKFCTYNAEAYKRFAITINAALKRLTDGRLFLEVFHPEYVGKPGYDNASRRAPFPMLQLCYEVSYSGP